MVTASLLGDFSLDSLHFHIQDSRRVFKEIQFARLFFGCYDSRRFIGVTGSSDILLCRKNIETVVLNQERSVATHTALFMTDIGIKVVENGSLLRLQLAFRNYFLT